jgi:signal transduction histidine kinase
MRQANHIHHDRHVPESGKRSVESGTQGRLRVLLVEDNPDDADLLERQLRRGGYAPEIERVETAEAMDAALARGGFDVIIADWSLPRFGALEALAFIKHRRLDRPFIIVSGTVDEELAVTALRSGAHDFLGKNKLARLVPAIERELREAEMRDERRTMEEQLLISERMTSMGMLVAGVGHEINNPLAALLANLDYTLKVLPDGLVLPSGAPDGGRVLSALRDARDAADRIRQIVRDLKIFSRSDEEKQSSIDVRQVLEPSLRMSWNEIRHRARLVKEYREVPPVRANEARLGQVFLNLLMNAAQAIPEGKSEENQVCVRTDTDAKGRAVIEVSDSGCGIEPENLEKIFEPFFTTKPVGVGTGLGLPICHRVVASMGGYLTVESKVGRGSTFRVVLPPSQDAAVPGPSSIPIASEPQRGKVLFIDDEPMIGEALQRLLSADHEVVAVSSAREALDRFRAGEHFDVVICDLMMPEMTGMDLHRELSELAPEQAERMVFATAGAFTPRAREFLAKVPNKQLEKPFDYERLRATVNALIK